MLISDENALKSEDSDEISDDFNEKYAKLQNNHRKLLGVTTVLTEALEHSVRGDDYNIETALNKCMKIYPELFTYHLKKPIKYRTKHKTYNTSEEDRNGISPEIHALNYTDNNTMRKINENESVNQNETVKISELNLPKIKTKFSNEKLTLDDFTNLNQINESPFYILTPEIRKNSFTFDRNGIFTPTPRSLNSDKLSDGNTYIVHHPESDDNFNALGFHFDKSALNLQGNKPNVEAEVKQNKYSQLSGEKYWPHEIVVQSIAERPETAQDSSGNVWIKIKPETSAKINPSAQTQTIIAKPLETCIIITNHPNEQAPNPKPENNTEQASSDVKNETMSKLQKLSKGLKVKSDKMITKATKSENQVETVVKPENAYFTNSFEVFDPKLTASSNDANKNHYKTLKSNLRNGSVKERASLLQSLRLTLIHSLAKERANLIASYIEYDILDLNNNPTLLESILPTEIINGWDLILQQMILKFINTMSSIWKGRDYITNNTRTIMHLQSHFFEKPHSKSMPDVISNDMLYAILNKLCTRENQHGILTNSVAVEKTLHHLYEMHNSISPYRLRHGLGLLIDLCVYNEGRALLEPLSTEVLSLITQLLDKNDKKMVPYVARLIYVLMANQKFHTRAKEIDLLSNIEKSMAVSNKRLKLQLDVLKSVINQPSPHEYLIGNEEGFLLNIEAEMDELEEEVEMGEPTLSSDEYNDIRNAFVSNKMPNDGENVTSDVGGSKKLKSSTESVPRRIPVVKSRKVKPKNTHLESLDLKQKSFIQLSDKPKFEPRIKPQPKKSKETIRTKITPKSSKHEIEEDEIAEAKRILINLIEDQKKEIINSSSVNPDCETSASDKIVDCDDDDLITRKEKHTSFVVLSEHDSNKTCSDLNLSSTSISLNSLEQVQIPDDLKKADELSSQLELTIEKQKVTSTSISKLNPDKLPNVSVFIQHGNVSEIDYEYCEDTKEIQLPVKYDNIFKDDRRSPYVGFIVTKSDSPQEVKNNEASTNSTAEPKI